MARASAKNDFEIDEQRWAEVQSRGLQSGAHTAPEKGMCAMEALSYIRRQPFSDHPPCVAPVIAAFMRAWNAASPLSGGGRETDKQEARDGR